MALTDVLRRGNGAQAPEAVSSKPIRLISTELEKALCAAFQETLGAKDIIDKVMAIEVKDVKKRQQGGEHKETVEYQLFKAIPPIYTLFEDQWRFHQSASQVTGEGANRLKVIHETRMEHLKHLHKRFTNEVNATCHNHGINTSYDIAPLGESKGASR